MTHIVPAGLTLLLAIVVVLAGCGDELIGNASNGEESRHSEAPKVEMEEGAVVNATTHADLYDAVFAAAHEELGSAEHSYTLSIPEDIAVNDTVEVGYSDAEVLEYYRFVQSGSGWQTDRLLHSFNRDELNTERAEKALASIGVASVQNEKPGQNGKAGLDRSYQIASLDLEQYTETGQRCKISSLPYLHSQNQHRCHNDNSNRALSYEFTDPSPVHSNFFHYDYNLTFDKWDVSVWPEGEDFPLRKTQTSANAECPFGVGCEEVNLSFSSRAANPEPPQTPPNLLAPADGATFSNPNDIWLQWERPAGTPPITYEIQVSTTPDFSNIVVERSHPAITRVDEIPSVLVDLDYNQTYYWRVRALNTKYKLPPSVWSNEPPYNQEPSFSTGSPAPQVSLSGPSYLDEGEMGTWTASPSGGDGSYTFDWELRMSHTSPWSGVCGSNISCTWGIDLISEYKNPTIRVTVTSGGQSASASKSFIVNNNGGSGGGGGDDPPGCDSIILGGEMVSESGEEIEPDKICP